MDYIPQIQEAKCLNSYPFQKLLNTKKIFKFNAKKIFFFLTSLFAVLRIITIRPLWYRTTAGTRRKTPEVVSLVPKWQQNVNLVANKWQVSLLLS